MKYDVDVKSDPATKRPAPPDFGALAKKYGMTAGKTGLVSDYDLSQLDVGQAANFMQRARLVQMVFASPASSALYKPDTCQVLHTRANYVFWKIEDQPEHVPKWDDPGIQAEVLRAWKLGEARKLARKRADDLKALAAASPAKSLADLPAKKKTTRSSDHCDSRS